MFLCNLSCIVLATLWLDKLHETFHGVTYPATAKIVPRQVARKVEVNSTFGNGSCNLSRNNFGRCSRVCYTVKCFVQLVLPQCRQNIAKQVARNIHSVHVTAPLGSIYHVRFPANAKITFLAQKVFFLAIWPISANQLQGYQ